MGLVLAVVAAGLAGVGGVLLLTRGDDRDDDPVEVVRDYFDAFSTGDCEATVDLIHTDGDDRAEWLDACHRAYAEQSEAMLGAELASAELVSQEGDHAAVRTEIVEHGEDEPGEPQDVLLVRVGGDWRIDLGDTIPDDSGGDATTTNPTTDDAAGDDQAP